MLPRSHPALVREGPLLRLEEVRTQLPSPGGLLVAMSCVGVCGTDLQILNGSRPDTASILGHEGMGVIVHAGQGTRLRKGDAVVFNPVAEISAGRLLGHNAPGLFQRYFALDASSAESGLVLRADAALSPTHGALVEPLGSIIYAHELICRVVPELRTAAVFGAGPIGILATLFLSALGIRVFLVHPHRARFDTLKSLSVLHETTTLLTCESLPQQILARNGGVRLDAALICTTRHGAPTALQHATEVVKDGGCIDLITNYPETTSAPAGLDTDATRAVRAANVCGLPIEGIYLDTEISGRRLAITGHRGTSANHLATAMRQLCSHGIPYARIITHVLSMESAAAAIGCLAHSRQHILQGRDCIKAVIDFTRHPALVPTCG